MKRISIVALASVGVSVATPALATEPTYQFFAGVSQIFLANGQEVGRSDVLVERILDPDRNLIVERVLSPDREHPGKYAEFVVDMKVDPAVGRMTLADRAKSFEGTGTLIGKAWEWARWSTISKMAGDLRVESSDEILADGLHAVKQVFRGDRLTVRMDEWYTPISAAAFEDRYYRLVIR